MHSLLEIQTAFAGALLRDGAAGPHDWLCDEGVSAAARIGIHRNNMQASLGEALAEMFPVVHRLVGEGFFTYAAHEFVRAHPPVSPCVADYGGAFAEFLSEFAPCRDLPYLPDVARFERMLHDAARCAIGPALEAAALASLDAGEAGELSFIFQPDRGYLCSPWPVTAIWRANQDGGDGAPDPQAEGALVEVYRRDGIVEFRELVPPAFAFRAALAGGAALADALAAVSDRDASFDAATALMNLFADRAVSGIRLREEKNDA